VEHHGVRSQIDQSTLLHFDLLHTFGLFNSSDIYHQLGYRLWHYLRKMATAHRVDSYSPPVAPVHNAQPLPRKMIDWQPLHLTFRHSALPALPTIHSPSIAAALRGRIYDVSAGSSGHSVKSLAWMGDAVLYLASTKACLKAGLEGGKSRCQQLGVSLVIDLDIRIG
jgi:hypothetical protein